MAEGRITYLIALALIVAGAALVIYSKSSEKTEDPIKFYSYEEGLRLARGQNKLVVMVVHSETCYVCRIFMEDLAKYPDLQQALLNFIPVKVDFNKDRAIVSKYGVTGTPEFHILDADGNVIEINGQKMVYLGYSTVPDNVNARKNFIAFLNYALQYAGSRELRLLNVVKGEEAIEQVKGIHIGSFEVVDAEIREYAGAGKIKVWVAYAETPEIAQQYVERMAGKVSQYFSEPESVDKPLKAYRVYGMGRTHYFFSLDSAVIWVEFENPDKAYHEDVLEKLFIQKGL
jgi:thioredoxin-related protein